LRRQNHNVPVDVFDMGGSKKEWPLGREHLLRAEGAGRLREELDPDGARQELVRVLPLLRPTEPYFDRSWPLPDFERL